jgi:hypothetical protein
LNILSCGTSCIAARPLSTPEVGVLIIIVIVAALLAAAGHQIISVIVLIAEAVSLGVRLVLRLRGNSQAQPGPMEA